MRNCILLISFLIVSNCGNNSISADNQRSLNKIESPIKLDVDKLNQKAKEAKAFCISKNFNQEICILIDMSIHSGLNRFFVWNFKKDTIYKSMLVSHGCGNNSWFSDLSKSNPSFSNEDESHCSSLGKYKVGKRGYSNWGINVNYLMYGLERSNSNALARQIVFHSWESVPDKEIYPNGTPEGWGCPAISNSNMVVVDSILKASTKPVLMWIFI